jgi:hypothetical protein
MLATLVAVSAIIGAGIGFVTVGILLRQTIQGAREKRAAEIAAAVKNATDPLREQLTSMTSERNYFRDRADAYETELRREKK